MGLTKVLVALYEEPDKPSDALSFVRNNFASSEMQTMRAQVDNLTKEKEQLETKVSSLEADKAALEKKISELEEVAADKEKKEESVTTPKPESPKTIQEDEVSNETPQEASVSAEESTTSPMKEVSSDVPVEAPLAVEETKPVDQVDPKPPAEEAEDPNSSEAMETDAPEPEPNAS